MIPLVIMKHLVAVQQLMLVAVVTAVSVGGGFVCAIVNGSVKCWGSGVDGELGQGNTNNVGGTTTIIPANIKPVK
jgi:hypothetical protein